MRLKSITLCWFRGAAKSIELSPNGKSLAVYGPNGAGKSSFVDAAEYVMNDGKVGHLRHDESGRLQEKGIPNTHKPEGEQTEFAIVFTDGTDVKVKIAQNGTHKKSGGQALKMSAWEYQRTVLRQNEVANFISSRKGEKYSALLPLLGLGGLEFAAENLRQLARSIEQQSQLAQKQGRLQAAAGRRKAIFGDAGDAVIDAKIAELHARYCHGSAAADTAARCKELAVAIAKRIAELTADNRRHLDLRTIAGADIGAATKAVRDSDAKLAGSVEPFINERVEVLQAAGVFAERLTTEEKVDCPACGRSIPAPDFKAHVTSEHDRLREIIGVFIERRAAVGVLVDILKRIKAAVSDAPLNDWREAAKAGKLKDHIEWLENIDPESLRHAMRAENLTAIEKHCPPIIQAADDASQNPPPDIQELARDKDLIDAATTVCEAAELAKEIKRIESLIAFLGAAEAGTREEIRARAETVIKNISDDVSDMWKVLHPGSPIENVHLYLPEEDKTIDIGLRFHGKDQDSPRLTLSEGYRNSLGLCLFLAMAKREAASDRPLLLDDVVVSFDRQHRGMIVDLLAQQFADRQVIVFTHDRDWFSDLRRQLDAAKWGFRVLRPYDTPLSGIQWADKPSSFDDARGFIKDHPDLACNEARKIMDVELSIVAERLQVRLPYLRGDKNDKRMWSEFLERIRADGKTCLEKRAGETYEHHAGGVDLLSAAEKLLTTWGNRGSHSPDVVPAEAEKLIAACEHALAVFQCEGCQKPVWLADVGGVRAVQCGCGQLRWRYGKG